MSFLDFELSNIFEHAHNKYTLYYPTIKMERKVKWSLTGQHHENETLHNKINQNEK
jgi:hypothetical protein